jgi:hypothetical protein
VKREDEGGGYNLETGFWSALRNRIRTRGKTRRHRRKNPTMMTLMKNISEETAVNTKRKPTIWQTL